MIASLPVPADLREAARTLLPALTRALHGTGPLLWPHPAEDAAPEALNPSRETSSVSGTSGGLPSPTDRGGLAVGTSGSTGAAKRAVLSARALTASADAAHERLGGPGRWLLALPAHHIAGLSVLTRSVLAGTTPHALPPGSFTASAFTDAVAGMSGSGRRYTSLVPTQLSRVLADPEATTAAAAFDAVLVGGSACPAELLAVARAAGIRVVTTYGMSETCGGCVYDGRPLHGVEVRLHDGRIHLAGPVLFDGYLASSRTGGVSRALDSFVHSHDGLDWFRTDDLGRFDADGALVVEGRADDVIITGGLKVWPTHIEATLVPVLPPGVEIAVVGLPDPQWGERIVLALTGADTRATHTPALPHTSLDPVPDPVFDPVLDPVLDTVLGAATRLLPPHARPRSGVVLEEFPRRGPGKTDRRALRSLLRGRGA